LPLLGLSSTNQGAKAGESVATVRVPAFWVRSRAGPQSWFPELPVAPVGWGDAGPDEALGFATTVAAPAPDEAEVPPEPELPDEQADRSSASAAGRARAIDLPVRVTAAPSVLGGLASAEV
jgi:hypothetical protein